MLWVSFPGKDLTCCVIAGQPASNMMQNISYSGYVHHWQYAVLEMLPVWEL